MPRQNNLTNEQKKFSTSQRQKFIKFYLKLYKLGQAIESDADSSDQAAAGLGVRDENCTD
jgi:hypothetical protein